MASAYRVDSADIVESVQSVDIVKTESVGECKGSVEGMYGGVQGVYRERTGSVQGMYRECTM